MKKIRLILIAVVALFGASYANAQISVTPEEVSISYGTYQDVVISSEWSIFDVRIDEAGSNLDLVGCTILNGNSRMLGEVIARIWPLTRREAFAIIRFIVRVVVEDELLEEAIIIAIYIIESSISNSPQTDYLAETLVALKQKDWVIETA